MRRVIRHSFKVGDRVAYTRSFVAHCCGYLKDYADLRGTIVSVEPLPAPARTDVCMVRWDPNPVWPEGENRDFRILSVNLWPADRLHLEPA